MSDSFQLYSPWNSPGQNTAVGSLSLLQGIFPTQGLNADLPHCRQIFYQLSHKGIPTDRWSGLRKLKDLISSPQALKKDLRAEPRHGPRQTIQRSPRLSLSAWGDILDWASPELLLQHLPEAWRQQCLRSDSPCHLTFTRMLSLDYLLFLASGICLGPATDTSLSLLSCLSLAPRSKDRLTGTLVVCKTVATLGTLGRKPNCRKAYFLKSTFHLATIHSWASDWLPLEEVLDFRTPTLCGDLWTLGSQWASKEWLGIIWGMREAQGMASFWSGWGPRVTWFCCQAHALEVLRWGRSIRQASCCWQVSPQGPHACVCTKSLQSLQFYGL